MKSKNPTTNKSSPANELEISINNWSCGVDPLIFLAVSVPCPKTEISLRKNMMNAPQVTANTECRMQITKNPDDPDDPITKAQYKKVPNYKTFIKLNFTKNREWVSKLDQYSYKHYIQLIWLFIE